MRRRTPVKRFVAGTMLVVLPLISCALLASMAAQMAADDAEPSVPRPHPANVRATGCGCDAECLCRRS